MHWFFDGPRGRRTNTGSNLDNLKILEEDIMDNFLIDGTFGQWALPNSNPRRDHGLSKLKAKISPALRHPNFYIVVVHPEPTPSFIRPVTGNLFIIVSRHL